MQFHENKDVKIEITVAGAFCLFEYCSVSWLLYTVLLLFSAKILR